MGRTCKLRDPNRTSASPDLLNVHKDTAVPKMTSWFTETPLLLPWFLSVTPSLVTCRSFFPASWDKGSHQFCLFHVS